MKKVQLNTYLPFILCTLLLQTAYASSKIDSHSAKLQQDENASATKLKKHNRYTHNHSGPLSNQSINTRDLKSETSAFVTRPESSTELPEYAWERNVRALEKKLSYAYQKVYNQLESSTKILDLQSYTNYMEVFLDLDEALTNEHTRLENLLSNSTNEQHENREQQRYLKDSIMWHGNLISNFNAYSTPNNTPSIRELSKKEKNEIQEKINSLRLQLHTLETRADELGKIMYKLNSEARSLKVVSDNAYKKHDKFAEDYKLHLKSINK